MKHGEELLLQKENAKREFDVGNSYLVATIECGNLNILLVISRRKMRMTSSHHVPYALSDTRATMDGTGGSQSRKDELTPKTCPRFELSAATPLHEVGIKIVEEGGK